MGFDVWSKDDIRNALVGVYAAHIGSINLREDDPAFAYEEGFRTAMISVALALGITVTDALVELRRLTVDPGRSVPHVQPLRTSRDGGQRTFLIIGEDCPPEP